MKIRLDEVGNPFILLRGKNDRMIAVKLDKESRDLQMYLMMSPREGLKKIRESLVVKDNGAIRVNLSVDEVLSFGIADAIVLLRNWTPETAETT